MYNYVCTCKPVDGGNSGGGVSTHLNNCIIKTETSTIFRVKYDVRSKYILESKSDACEQHEVQAIVKLSRFFLKNVLSILYSVDAHWYFD